MAVAVSAPPKKELGSLLLQQGLISQPQLTRALSHQKDTGKAMGQVLIELDLVAEEDITRARASQVDLPYVRMEDLTVDKGVLSLVDAAVARKFRLLPVGKTPDGTLKIIVAAWNAHVMEMATKIASSHRLRIAPPLRQKAI